MLEKLDINIYSHFLNIIRRYMELKKCEKEEKVDTAILHVQYAILDINSQIGIFNPDNPQLSVYYQTMIKTDFFINVVEELYESFFNKKGKCVWGKHFSEIRKFRLYRSLTLAHPLETTYYEEFGFGKENNKWCEDVQPKGIIFDRNLKDADYVMVIKEKGKQVTSKVPISVKDDILSVAKIALGKLQFFTKKLDEKLILLEEKLKETLIPINKDMDILEYIKILLAELEIRYPSEIQKIEYEDGRVETYCILIDAYEMLSYIFNDSSKEEIFEQYKREIRKSIYYYGTSLQNMDLEETQAHERLSRILNPSVLTFIEKSNDKQAHYKHEKIKEYLSRSKECSFERAKKKLMELSYDGCKEVGICTNAEWGVIQLLMMRDEFIPYFPIDFNATDKEIYYQYLTALYYANKSLN